MKMDESYLDETILSVINSYEEALEREAPLAYQIKVKGQIIKLGDREIYPGVSMRLPRNFIWKAGNETEKGYMIKNHPESVLTSGCGSVNYTFDRFSLEGKEALALRDELIVMMDQEYPRNTVYKKGTQYNGDIDVHWFEFKSFAFDSDVYNNMFLFSVQEDAVIGAFHCSFRDYKEWENHVIKMLDTIMYIQKEKEK